MFRRGAKDDPEDLDTAMRRIEEESRRMGVMVDELLLLARLGEGREPEREPVDMARVVADAVGDARAADDDTRHLARRPAGADRHRRRAPAAPGGRQPARQRPHAHAVETAPCTCVCSTRRGEAGMAVLEVADEGPGLTPEMAAKVFEPFYRVGQVAGAAVRRRRPRARHRRRDRRGARRLGRPRDVAGPGSRVHGPAAAGSGSRRSAGRFVGRTPRRRPGGLSKVKLGRRCPVVPSRQNLIPTIGVG